MAGGERRFSATYTKHIKQKRKVYQDGYLLISNNNNKVMLYDDSEKLLDSKFLKKDETVKPGESLAFASYLVDIGDPEAGHEPLSNNNSQFQQEDTRTSERVDQQLHVNNSMSRDCNRGRKKVPVFKASPSQMIIKEFKKNETLKYGIQQSPSTAASPVVKEWQVLYTTQLTQKAKKYHDGSMQVVTCGSQGRQLKLFDSDNILLESRFLKKAEVIKSNESLRLTAHLVDIGEPLIKHEHPVELAGSNTSVSAADTVLPNSESQRLSSDVFLADNSFSTGGSDQDAMEDSSRLRNSAVEKQKSWESLPASKPLRDACGILSNLRKSVAADSGPSMMVAPTKQYLVLSSEVVSLLDTENNNQIATGRTLGPGNVAGCSHQPKKSLKEELSGKSRYTSSILEPIHNRTDTSCKPKQEKNHDNGVSTLLGGRASVDIPSGASKLKMARNEECSPHVTGRTTSSKGLKMCDTDASSQGSSRAATRRAPLVAVTMGSASVDHGDSLKSACTRDRRDYLPRMSVNNGGCYQRFTEFTDAGLLSAAEETSNSLKNSRREGFVSQNIRDDHKITVETSSPAKIGDCPSFDLGF